MSWSEHRDPTGRIYFFNSTTKQSSWEKPPELKTALERALDYSDWKEYHSNGRKYYHNHSTGETTWKLPEEFTEIQLSMKYEQEHQVQKHQPMILNFETKEEAEAAWIEMLAVVGCEPSWSWEDCVRKASGHPVYRALKTVQERRECFETYCKNKLQENRERRMSKKEKDEQKLLDLFKKHKVQPTTRFRTAQRIFADEPDWNQCPANHRRTVFFQYVDNLKNAQKNAERETRKANLAKLKQLFTTLDIDHTISWRDAQQKWQSHELFKSDENLAKMDPMDVLIAFEDWVMTLDSKYRQSRNVRLRTELRHDRRIRDAYKGLLREHAKDGKITRIKWKEFYPLIKSDKRYLEMMDTIGSSPLDLFWDLQMKLDDDYRSDRHDISDLVKVLWLTQKSELDIPTLTLDVLVAKLQEEKIKIPSHHIEMALHDVSLLIQLKNRHEKDEKRNAERALRKKIDAVRQVWKHLPLPATASFEEACRLVSETSEFAVLDQEQLRIAYDKYMARLAVHQLTQERNDPDKRYKKKRHHSDSESDDEKRSRRDERDKRDDKRRRSVSPDRRDGRDSRDSRDRRDVRSKYHSKDREDSSRRSVDEPRASRHSRELSPPRRSREREDSRTRRRSRDRGESMNRRSRSPRTRDAKPEHEPKRDPVDEESEEGELKD